MFKYHLHIFIAILSTLSFNAYCNQHAIDSLKAIDKNSISKRELVDNYNQLSYDYGGENIDSSVFYSSSAIRIAKEILYEEGLAMAYLFSARGNIEKGNIKLATERFNQSIQIYEKLQDTIQLLNAYRGLSYVASYDNNKLKALEVNLKTLEFAEHLKDTASLSIIYNNIGTSYLALKNYDQCIHHFKKSLSLEIQRADPREQAVCNSNIGYAYLKSNNVKDAKPYFEELQRLIPMISSDYIEAYMFLSLSRYYLAIDRLDSCKHYLDQSVELCRKGEFHHIRTRAHKELGIYFMKKKQYLSGIRSLKYNLKLSDSIGISEDETEVYRLLSQAYEKKGLYKQAHQYAHLVIQTIDSLQNESMASFLEEYEDQQVINKLQQKDLQIALRDKTHAHETYQLEAKIHLAIAISALLVLSIALVIVFLYRTQRKNEKLNEQHALIEKQKQLLENTNKVLKANEATLKELNLTKDKFFSIIAHDLKSPFSGIIGLSEEFAENAAEMPPEETQQLAKQMHNSLQNTYELLENLLEWSRINTGTLAPTKKQVHTSQLIKETLSTCLPMAQAKNIAINTTDTYSDELLLDQEMIKTVLRNLVTNAIKFSYEDSQIMLKVEPADQFVEFSVIDHGVGIDIKHLHKLFKIDSGLSRKGTRNEKGTGLGLILSHEFIMKHSGTFTVDSLVGEGSTFTFSLPQVAK